VRESLIGGSTMQRKTEKRKRDRGVGRSNFLLRRGILSFIALDLARGLLAWELGAICTER
jgi:hypothetical protein